MRKAAIALVLPLALLALVAAGCGGDDNGSTTESTTSTETSTSTGSTAATSCDKGNLTLVKAGALTVGTDNPAYPPWFGGGSPKGSKWKINDPSTGKGFESAVAYAVAKELGFARSEVEWTYVPFNRSFAPGTKPFDFDINQISITPARAKVVTFSSPYYDQNQAIVVLKGTRHRQGDHGRRPARRTSSAPSSARRATTTSRTSIKPSSSPAVFPQNAGAVQALKNGQIDGLVVDLPTAFYVTAVQVPKGTILGQFPAVPGGEHFGMVFPKGNSLASCVNDALATLKQNGTLAADPAAVASEGDRRPGPQVTPEVEARSSKVLGGWHSGGSGRRSVADRACEHGRLLRRDRRSRSRARRAGRRSRARSSTGTSSATRCPRSRGRFC